VKQSTSEIPAHRSGSSGVHALRRIQKPSSGSCPARSASGPTGPAGDTPPIGDAPPVAAATAATPHSAALIALECAPSWPCAARPSPCSRSAPSARPSAGSAASRRRRGASCPSSPPPPRPAATAPTDPWRCAARSAHLATCAPPQIGVWGAEFAVDSRSLRRSRHSESLSDLAAGWDSAPALRAAES
jgi:hypothetical protein